MLHIGYLGWNGPSRKVLRALMMWSHDLMWQIRNVQSFFSEEQLPANFAKVVTEEGRLSRLLSQMTLFMWLQRLHDDLKTLDFLLQKTCGHRTFKTRGLTRGVPGYQVILPLDYKITWQMKKDFSKTRRRPIVKCDVSKLW